MIVALVVMGGRQTPTDLISTLAWASVAGAALQFLVQVPTTLALVHRLRLDPSLGDANVRTVLRNFAPVFVSRGVVQISGYIDNWLATFLPDGMVAAFGYAPTIFVLPVSLFGMAVSAAELPEMSRVVGHGGGHRGAAARESRPRTSQHRVFRRAVRRRVLAFGDVIARVLLQRGRFTHADSLYTWGILAGSAVGLLASTLGRLYSSAYYALHDTRTPLRFAIVRVVLTTVLGYIFALPLPRIARHRRALGRGGPDRVRRHRRLGRVHSAACAAQSAHRRHRGSVRARFARSGRPRSSGSRAGWGLARLLTGDFTSRLSFLDAVLVHRVYGVTYLAMTIALRVPEARTAISPA